MKRAFALFLAVGLLFGISGCQSGPRGFLPWFGSCKRAPDGCRSCGGGRLSDRGCQDQVADPGPATGAVTYPYYTVRGPRDFLASDPRSIGP